MADDAEVPAVGTLCGVVTDNIITMLFNTLDSFNFFNAMFNNYNVSRTYVPLSFTRYYNLTWP